MGAVEAEHIGVATGDEVDVSEPPADEPVCGFLAGKQVGLIGTDRVPRVEQPSLR